MIPGLTSLARFRQLRFWAKDGMIMLVDERDGSEHQITVRDFLRRLLALNQVIGSLPYTDERDELQRLVEKGIDVARQAREQGDPTRADVIRFNSRHPQQTSVSLYVPIHALWNTPTTDASRVSPTHQPSESPADPSESSPERSGTAD